ncbi:MAG: metal ABC transporter substrate-binding protein [Acutalibacteraceae bacterium]|nr:metal ABC transporter substrate-binding protein [Acutalibacteraceae bacterium]
MRRITRIFAFVLCISLLCCMFGCDLFEKKETPDTPTAIGRKNDRVSVVTTIFPPYDFTRQIAGNLADVTMLLGPGEESHTYEPTPQDIIKIQKCDIFIYTGGESESWAEDILSSLDNKSVKIINMMEITDVVEEEIVEGMENDEESEQDEAETGDEAQQHETEYDEHVWTSISNAQKITQAIADALCELDEQNSAVYTSGCERYLGELSSLKKTFTRIVADGTRKTVVFGDRFPFRYFTDEFGLEYFAAFPGCAEQSEPSAGTVAFLIEKVKEESIPVVFYIEMSNGKVAETIAESTGAETMRFHSCHNVTMDEYVNNTTYIDLMKQNAEALEKALN